MQKQEILKNIYEMARRCEYFEHFEREFDNYTKELTECTRCGSKSFKTVVIGFIRQCKECYFKF